MPCKIQINKNLVNKVQLMSNDALSKSLIEANKIAADINKKFQTPVVSFMKTSSGKLERSIFIPESLVDIYYKHELSIEKQDGSKSFIGVNNLQFTNKGLDINDKKPSGSINYELEKSLVDGFLKDFNINIQKYQDIKEDLGIDAYSASDLIAKAIVYQEGESILPEVAYFGFMMLGNTNNKLRSDLRYLISKWDKYAERFEHHKNIVSDKIGFMSDKEQWKRKINDLVILDFLSENIKTHFENPQEFEKVLDRKWTRDDFTLWEKIMTAIKKVLKNFSSVNNQYKNKLKNIGLSIADEIISRNYEYFNYQKAENQIQKYYNQTIESDSFAKQIVNDGQKIGLILTGSLALRKSGTVYRTIEESIHDIDFVVPYDLSNSTENKKIIQNIINHQGVDIEFASQFALKHLQSTTWFKDFVKMHPSFKVTNGFYGRDNGYNSYTIQGVINAETYKSAGTHEESYSYYKKDSVTKKEYKVTQTRNVKHAKGEIINGTGYAIDFFVRLNVGLDEHENYFKLWKEIMLAKLAMGRDKDFIDWKHYIPYVKSKDSFNFNFEGFRHFNHESTGNALEDLKNDLNNKFELDLNNLNLTPEVVNYLYKESSNRMSKENFGIQAKELISILQGSNLTNQEILEKLKCL